jgi:hypothetical protein
MSRTFDVDGTSVTRLIRIGYWAGDDGRWPDVHDFVDANWAKDDQVDCLQYLRRGVLARAYFGPSFCRFCGKLNGSVELTDFVYTCPEGLEHYLAEHASGSRMSSFGMSGSRHG